MKPEVDEGSNLCYSAFDEEDNLGHGVLSVPQFDARQEERTRNYLPRLKSAFTQMQLVRLYGLCASHSGTNARVAALFAGGVREESLQDVMTFTMHGKCYRLRCDDNAVVMDQVTASGKVTGDHGVLVMRAEAGKTMPEWL